jgi:uncharacterized protein YhaN
MRIKKIEIDGFGVWNGLQLDELADQTTVVYGCNEAGKTTLMQFIRAVIYGFTPERRKRYLPPVHGGAPGGRLRLANEFGSFQVHRYDSPDDPPENLGRVEIIDDRDEPRDPAHLEVLLADIDEPTYSNVFAVGLKEIQELGSLDDTAAADYLYRLTSGLDRVSLVDVIREVEAARQRLLAANDSTLSQIPHLTLRRDKLKSQIDTLSQNTKRWNELLAQRSRLTAEADQLSNETAQIESASGLLRAALDVEGPWNLRSDVRRQLEILKNVRALPERSLERLDSLNQRLATGQKRLKKLGARRESLKNDLSSLEVNKVLLSHAGRIESLHDQSQWIIGLENQVTKLREEVKKLDGDIEAAVTGYRSSSSSSLDELPRETMTVLKRPAQVVREESEKLDKAKQEADEAKRAFDLATQQYDQVSRSKRLSDLGQAIQEAGTKVSLLRKRIQIEERLDQLTRRRQELEVDTSDIGTYEESPLRITALVGLFFSLGVMFILIGTIGSWYNFVSSGWMYSMFGCFVVGGTVLGKLLLEKNSDEQVNDGFRQLEQLRMQLTDVKRERDELDAELPGSTGSLDARLREAEIELRDLERLIPVRTEREQAEQRHQAAQRNLTAAQEAVKEARHRWKNALRSIGLPEDFAPPKVKQVVKSNEQVLELRRRRDSRKDELDERERELLLVNNRLQQILDDVRITCISDQPVARVRELIQAVAKEKETLNLRDDVDKRLRKLARSRDKVIASLRKASRGRHALLTLAGVENEKAFRQAAADWARVADLKRQEAELSLRIQTTLAGGRFNEKDVTEVFETEGRDVKVRWDQRQAQLAEIRSRLAQIHERRGAAAHEMQSLANDRQMGQAALELGAVEVQLESAIRRWKILTIVSRLLEVVRKRYETDRQPETLREASQYLVRLTDGHYRRVWMPLDRRGLLIENDQGESLSLDVLSRGTREAVFIGLRLALVGSFSRRGATVPLVLDDVLVNFDTARVRCAAEVLCDFARQGHQVIMFTCHEHITDIFEDAQANICVLPTRDGTRPNRRRSRATVELPPPTPSLIPDEPVPVRHPPHIDPNPLFQMSAHDGPEFDPVYPLPTKRDRRKKHRQPAHWQTEEFSALSEAWHKRFRDVLDASHEQKPVAEVPPAADIQNLSPYYPDTFEVLAFRGSPDAWSLEVEPQAVTAPSPAILVHSSAESVPPPNHLAVAREPKRFAWASPEMYREEGD